MYKAQLLEYQHHALDLNDHGQIAGEYRGTIQRGAYFDGVRWIPRGNGDDYSWSALYGINNQGLAVGLNTISPQISTSLVVHAIRVGGDGALINLGSLTGENGNARARAINDSNLAVGDSLNRGGKRVAVRFELNGTVLDLSLDSDTSSAVDINNVGDIIGELISATGLTKGFYLPWDGIPTDIGTLGGAETFVTRINSRREIVGRSKISTGEVHAFVHRDGEMVDLGTLGGKESAAYGINDAGVIVGAAMRTNGTWAPFLKYPGQPMMDLADLVKVPEPDILISATAINNVGQIIVRGMHNESNYLLNPEPFSFQITGGKIRMNYNGPAGLLLRIDTAETLPNWRVVSTNTLDAEQITLEFPLTAGNAFFRAVLSAAE